MNLISLAVVFLIEQMRPLPRANPVHQLLVSYTDKLSTRFNAGERRQGLMAWLFAVVPWVAGAMLVYGLLVSINPVLALIFNVAVLYFVMGFRQIGHSFNAVLEALRTGDTDAARIALTNWRNQPADELDDTEIAKIAIEDGLLGAHRQIFGVMFWFILVPGPAGAVLYRLSALLADKWGTRGGEEYVQFGAFSRKAFEVLDWIPSRLTAITFAIVGDFEDAIYCWRTQSNSWGNVEQGIVLASGAGALGVRLGEALHQDGTVSFRPELGLGDQPDVSHMASGIGLVWRSAVMWMSVIALVTFAIWFG
jgi:adenosylcobinamide-phosphate synthase